MSRNRGSFVNDSDSSGRTVHFIDSTVPATSPPLVRLRLATPHGGRLIMNPTMGNQFVSAGDVKRMIIAWMCGIEQVIHGLEEGPGLAQRRAVRTRNGATMDVDVWVWRGLLKVMGSVDLWEIVL